MGALKQRGRPAAKPRANSVRELRELLEHGIEHLVQLLDQIDGDPDLEPCVGATGGAASYPTDQREWALGVTDDREKEHDGREPGEDEHNLGRSENVDQTQPDYGQDDREPSLGSTVLMDQTRWGEEPGVWMAYADLEEQCEDEGGACEDEGVDTDRERDWDSDGPAPDDDAFLVAVTAEHRALQPAGKGRSLPDLRPSWVNVSEKATPLEQRSDGVIHVPMRMTGSR